MFTGVREYLSMIKIQRTILTKAAPFECLPFSSMEVSRSSFATEPKGPKKIPSSGGACSRIKKKSSENTLMPSGEIADKLETLNAA